MHDELRKIIREILEEKSLDEFSGAGAVAGFTLPLGMSNKRVNHKKKKKKLRESRQKSHRGMSGEVVGDEDFTFNNFIRYYDNEDSYDSEEHWQYYDMIDCLVRSFAGAGNPFGDNKKSGSKKSTKYLQGFFKYPHGT